LAQRLTKERVLSIRKLQKNTVTATHAAIPSMKPMVVQVLLVLTCLLWRSFFLSPLLIVAIAIAIAITLTITITTSCHLRSSTAQGQRARHSRSAR